MGKHSNVDKNLNYSISQDHFERWLHIWFGTIEDLYEGDLAEFAKMKARKMATGQFLAIWNRRPGNNYPNP